MDDNEIRRRLDEALNKVEGAKELYRNSAFFHSAIQSLVRGADPVELLFIVSKALESTDKRFLEHIMLCRDVKPIIIPRHL